VEKKKHGGEPSPRGNNVGSSQFKYLPVGAKLKAQGKPDRKREKKNTKENVKGEETGVRLSKKCSRTDLRIGGRLSTKRTESQRPCGKNEKNIAARLRGNLSWNLLYRMRNQLSGRCGVKKNPQRKEERNYEFTFEKRVETGNGF